MGYTCEIQKLQDSNEVLLVIDGMTCPSCVNSIESCLKNNEGVMDVSINLITKMARIQVNPDVIGEIIFYEQQIY